MGGNRDYPKPVKKIALSEKFPKWRLFCAIIFGVLGAAALASAAAAYLHVDTGWKVIEVPSSAKANCGGEFSFQYELGQGGASAAAQNRALTALYTELSVKAYELFHENQGFDGVHNLYYINMHPNEPIEVDRALYRAFEAVQQSGSRWLYMAPVYADYRNLFLCNDDAETASYDPYRNGEVAAYFSEIAAYAQDASQVNVELLGENRIRLHVSQAYGAYAQEMGITCFIDFFLLRNAFIIDYLADGLAAEGYTAGHITSYDGFFRNMDGRGGIYSYQLYDRTGLHVYPAALMEYQGAVGIVSLRNYPMGVLDRQHYYELADGEIRTSYIDSADGLCKSAVNNLTGYAYGRGCAELALCLMPVYAADSLDGTALGELRGQGIYTVYGDGEEHLLFYNEASLALTGLYENGEIKYRLVLNE